ncbi:MAG: YlxR family protein [Bacilli bacterium]|nr:YlxR family protein [Bacilli bacterium]
MKVKKIPMRTCVVTKEKLPKKDLLRIVKFDGVVSVDATGKQNGKGCYIKKDRDTLLKAKKSKILDRVLETTIEDNIYDQIEKLIA